jgi:hypothetical protein
MQPGLCWNDRFIRAGPPVIAHPGYPGATMFHHFFL